MIKLKSAEDIEKLAAGGVILAGILDELEKKAEVGAVPKDLDQLSQDLIKQAGCVPAFLNYAPGKHKPFPAALCVSVNQAVVHGLPSNIPLADGDVVGIDLGLIYEDKYYLDSARTVAVGEVSEEAKELMAVTEKALKIGIEQAQVGKTTGDIGAAIQEYVEGRGFEVVRVLVGHGVGFDVHEDPKVPNFGTAGEGERLEEGLVIAIEPMVTIGSADIKQASDGWTIETTGGGLAAHEEHTVAITASGSRVLTTSFNG